MASDARGAAVDVAFQQRKRLATGAMMPHPNDCWYAIIRPLKAENAKLEAENAALKARIAELESKALNAPNSEA